jgi:hypothetical protein
MASSEEKRSSTDDKAVSETIVTTDDVVYPTGFKLFAIIVALCLAVFLVSLDQSIIVTAIPRITDRFNSVLDIGWYGSVGIPYLGPTWMHFLRPLRPISSPAPRCNPFLAASTKLLMYVTFLPSLLAPPLKRH